MATYTQEVHSVWRLKREGTWDLLYQSPEQSTSTERMTSIVEWIANLCLEHFPHRSQWTSEVGDQSLLAYHDENGVLMGLYPTGNNTTLVRTAMQKIEQAQPPLKALSQPPQSTDSSSKNPTLSLKPLTPSSSEQGSHKPEAPEPQDKTSLSLSDESAAPSSKPQTNSQGSMISFTELPHTAQHLEGASLFETIQGGEMEPLPLVRDPAPELPSRELAPKDLLLLAASKETSSLVPKEQEEDVASLSHLPRGLPISMEFEPPSMTSLQQLPEASSSLCLWRDVAEFVKQTIDDTSPMLGQTVVANYWRKALAPHSLLNDCIPINPLGEVKVPYPNRVVHDEIAHQLQTVYEHWIQRCSRVIRNFPAHVESLPTPPWKKPNI
ncbi:MAG: hypothetical protein EP343_12880 [Deltaproteobacteria bacterium]|nr:MAG: hypothetical protein EP343_12880 [Deltaproteobacteria bacterium]